VFIRRPAFSSPVQTDLHPMNLPATINAKILRELAAPNETHAVRVVCLRTSGPTQFRFRGIKRQYLFERDGVSGMHVLDVPQSLWMDGVSAGAYRPNLSIAHDMQARPLPMVPLLTLLVPWGPAKADAGAPPASDAAPVTPSPDLFPPLRELLTKLGAPGILFDALHVLEHEGIGNFQSFVDCLPDDGVIVGSPEVAAPAKAAQPSPAIETPAAKRMREKRARDKAKKQLQPA
jgi:hypothetical protein